MTSDRPARGERRAEMKAAFHTMPRSVSMSFAEFHHANNDGSLNAEHSRDRKAARAVSGDGNRAMRRQRAHKERHDDHAQA